MKLIYCYVVFTLLIAADFSTNAEEIRLLSLSPSLTETIYKLGGQDKLKGRSSACNYPPQAKKLPVCGDYKGPNLEKIIQLKINVIISALLKDKAVINNIESLGIKYYNLPSEKLRDYPDTVKNIGKILDLQKAAEKEISRYNESLDKFKTATGKIPREQKPKVLMLIYDRPLMSVGNKSFIHEMINIAGGRNIAEKVKRSYFNCSMEWVMKKQPDVIVMPFSNKQKIAELCRQPGWRSLKAVRNKRIYYQNHNDILYRLGPRTMEGIAALQKYFYPKPKTRQKIAIIKHNYPAKQGKNCK